MMWFLTQLILAGVEILLFIVASMELSFGFVL